MFSLTGMLPCTANVVSSSPAVSVSSVQLVQMAGILPELPRSPGESGLHMTERSTTRFDMQNMQAQPQGQLGG